MKRLLFVASLAMLAVGCQKTFVENEVQNSIGFNTEVGKQTRAIVSGTTAYPDNQPFAVYAHAYQSDVYTNTVMNNIEISKNTSWKATGTTAYYWPNDPRTVINFYAYSPAHSAAVTATDADKKLNGTIGHDYESNTLSLTGYTHSNMYVDFMVATPVKGATFSDQNGEATDKDPKDESVPVSFHHQMTQIIFNVKTKEYTGVTFTVNSITFNRILNAASFEQDYADNYGTWTPAATVDSYDIFPADGEAASVVDHTDAKTLKTTPVTMIPQTLTATDKVASDDIISAGGQSFTVEYTIAGNGVASETVVKTFEFADAATAPAWNPNAKITYTLTIGLNEITFAPSVVDWEPGSGSYDIDDNI